MLHAGKKGVAGMDVQHTPPEKTRLILAAPSDRTIDILETGII
jgi:hypothetical protein